MSLDDVGMDGGDSGGLFSNSGGERRRSHRRVLQFVKAFGFLIQKWFGVWSLYSSWRKREMSQKFCK